MGHFFKRQQLTGAQLEKIEHIYGVQLPSELRRYIQEHPSSPMPGRLMWGVNPEDIKVQQEALFVSALKFDLENNEDYWPRVFGVRPLSDEDRLDIAMEYIKQLPPLIPVGALKYYVPTLVANDGLRLPVISFHQFVDTIFMYESLDAFAKKRVQGLQSLPGVPGWDKVFDGLGAVASEIYIGDAHDS